MMRLILLSLLLPSMGELFAESSDIASIPSSSWGAIGYEKVAPPSPEVAFLDDIEYEASVTVVYEAFEGGFYGLETDEGQKLYPLNLPQIYESDGMEISITYKMADTIVASAWGVPIIIETIE